MLPVTNLANLPEARFWTTSRLPSIHQLLNTSVFSEEMPSRDDEQYNYVVLAKAADLPGTLDSA